MLIGRSHRNACSSRGGHTGAMADGPAPVRVVLLSLVLALVAAAVAALAPPASSVRMTTADGETTTESSSSNLEGSESQP